MATFCTAIKLSGRFVSRPCLKHPPKCYIISTSWTINRCCWQCIQSLLGLHDFERALGGTICIPYQIPFYLRFFFFSLHNKTTFWTREDAFFNLRFHASFTFRTKLHEVTPRLNISLRHPLSGYQAI